MCAALTPKREQVTRCAESIPHDESLVDNWEVTIVNLHPGGRADEMRDALEGKRADVSARLDSKRARLADLAAAIADIAGQINA